MSIAGIRIRNNTSVVQIDTRYKNLGLRYSATITAASSGGTANGFYAATWTVPYSATQILAWRAAANTCLISSVSSGGNITYTLWIAQAGGQIQVRIFDDPNLSSYTAGVAGIVIRDPATGLKAFDSRARYMRVVSFQSSTSNGSPVTVAPAGVGNLFCCQLQPMWGRFVTALSQTTRIIVWASSCVTFSGNTATISQQSIDSYTDNNNANVWTIVQRAGYTLMFIDCLGF